VFTFLPVLPLAGFAAVENKFATGTSLKEKVRAVAGADSAVGTLSQIARAGLAGNGKGAGRGRSRSQAFEESGNLGMAKLHRKILKLECLKTDLKECMTYQVI